MDDEEELFPKEDNEDNNGGGGKRGGGGGGGEAQKGVLQVVEIHNSIVTFPTPNCNSVT